MHLKTLEDYKQIYELWVKFLRLSDDYNDYCKLIKDSFDAAYDRFGNRFLGTYSFFGDVSPETFEAWWNNGRVQRAIERYSRKVFKIDEVIEHYAEAMGGKLIENTTTERRRLPSTIVRDQLKALVGERPRSITLTVYTDYGVKELVKSFKKIIGKHKASGRPRSEDRVFIPFPHGEFTTSNIADYFEIFTRYQKYKGQSQRGDLWRSIINEFKPHSIPEDSPVSKDQRDHYYRYMKRGEAIKKNVEAGVFPW